MTEAKIRSSCDTCLSTKVKCSQAKPSCSRCSQRGQPCVYSQYRKIGRPSHKSLAEKAALSGQPAPTRSTKDASKVSKKQQSRPRQKQETAAKRRRQAQGYELSLQHAEHRAAFPHVNHNQIVFSATPLSRPPTDYYLPPGSVNPSHLMAAPVHPSSPITDTASSGQLSYGYHVGEYDVGTVEWPCLSNDMDLSATGLPSPVTNYATSTPYDSPSQCIGSPISLTLPSMASPETSPGLADLTPQPSPYYDVSPIEEQPAPVLYPNHLSMDNGSPQESSPLRGADSEPAQGSFPASDAAFIRPSETIAPVTLESRCVLDCITSLCDQLAYITEFQALDFQLNLDVLFNVDENIRKGRERILGCPVCLTKAHCGQTLLLMTMALGNLIGLFERHFIRDHSRACNCPPVGRSPSSNIDTGRSGHAEPSMRCTKIQLGDTLDVGFSKHMLRMYLERQMGVVSWLEYILSTANGKDITCKVTSEVLEEIMKRLERFLGIIALSGELESGSGSPATTRAAVAS